MSVFAGTVLFVWFFLIYLFRNTGYGWIQPAVVLALALAFPGPVGLASMLWVMPLSLAIFWLWPRYAMRYVFDGGFEGKVYDGYPDDN